MRQLPTVIDEAVRAVIRTLPEVYEELADKIIERILSRPFFLPRK